ncbi:MAG: hypothetical protein WCF57_19310 [Pyrinomonadaceae bacterium]
MCSSLNDLTSLFDGLPSGKAVNLIGKQRAGMLNDSPTGRAAFNRTPGASA